MNASTISRRGLFCLLAALTCLAAAAGPVLPATGRARADTVSRTYLISAGPPGVDPAPPLTHANRSSEYARTSYDGMRIVFTSDATNLDPAVKTPDNGGDYLNENEGSWDVFLRVIDPTDPSQGSTYLVSSDIDSTISYDPLNPFLIAAGAAGPGSDSAWAAISRDGKWIVLQSDSRRIVSADSERTDIFLLSADNVINRTVAPFRAIVSQRSSAPLVKANGPSGNLTLDAISRVFTDPYPPAAIYLKTDNQPCVVYQSEASNLDPAFSDANGRADLFVWCRQGSEGDLNEKVNRLLTRTASGAASDGAAWSPSVSYSGRYVAFVSDATNLVPAASGTQVYLMDRDPDADGNLNNSNPVYSLVSASAAGLPGSAKSWYPSISANGNFVAFASYADNLETQKSDFGQTASLADTNAVADIYLYDHRTGRTELVSLRMSPTSLLTGGGSVDNLPRLLGRDSLTPSISADGRYVVFKTLDNYVTADLDDNIYEVGTPAPDIFRYDRLEPNPAAQVIKISLADDSTQTQYWQTAFPAISGDKRFVFFTSDDPILPEGNSAPAEPLPYYRNIFARDLGPAAGEAVLGIDQSGDGFFGVAPGTGSKSVVYTLRNWGAVTLNVTGLEIPPPTEPHTQESDFNLSSGACAGLTGILDPAVAGMATNDSCAVTVTYEPANDGWWGKRQAILTVNWEAAGDPQLHTDTILLEGGFSAGTYLIFLPGIRR